MSTTTRTAALAGALALAVAAGCESRAQVAACPGTAVATLAFQGVQQPGGCAAVGADAGVDAGVVAFTGTLAYGSSGEAYLCLDRAEAAPLTGNHIGDHVTVRAPAVAATLPACGCPLSLTEQLDGDLLRADAGPSGFSGTLSEEFEPPDGGTAGCDRGGGTRCDLPCVARWTVTAGP